MSAVNYSITDPPPSFYQVLCCSAEIGMNDYIVKPFLIDKIGMHSYNASTLDNTKAPEVGDSNSDLGDQDFNLISTICQYLPASQGKLLMIYICNFHVLNHLLLIYMCKLHWNLKRLFLGNSKKSVMRNQCKKSTCFSKRI